MLDRIHEKEEQSNPQGKGSWNHDLLIMTKDNYVNPVDGYANPSHRTKHAKEFTGVRSRSLLKADTLVNMFEPETQIVRYS